MDIVIPCLRKINWDKGGGDTSVSFAYMPGEDGGGGVVILISPSNSPIDIAVSPFPPYIIPVPDFTVIFNDLFGLSHIQIQKEEIQKYLTQVFRYIHNVYGFPLRDDHALQFPSDGVKKWLGRRPDLAAQAPLMQDQADQIVTGAFGYQKSGPGIRQRMVNQFLANAAINEWPLDATIQLWDALVTASTCSVPTFAPAPTPPPPEPVPPPAPQRNCPPGMTQEDCLALCGQIRQLSAAQLPIPGNLVDLLSYFEDCFAAPDGSWTYQAPAIGSGWQGGFPQAFPWLPAGTKLVRPPAWSWPYNWDAATTQIDEISVSPTGSNYPVGTLLVQEQGQTPYVILPSGEVQCFGDQIPPPDVTEEEPPPEPPPPEPPPEPIPPAVQQLRSDFDGLQQDYLQFKQQVFTSLDAIKRALWQSMIRGNFQASTLFSRVQPGWQGLPPPSDQPPYPLSWQELPTPGAPQVLEIPPIQDFPQVTTEGVEFTQLRTELLDEVSLHISTYNTEVVQPALQQIRDDCCTPATSQPPEQPVDICNEGREKWGLMAECWLDANTPTVDAALVRAPVNLDGQNFVTTLRQGLGDAPTGWFADMTANFMDKLKAGLTTGIMPAPIPAPVDPAIDTTYVYVPVPVV